jgi:hypothetical protein
MQYVVQTVGDDDLPDGIHWVTVEQLDGTTVLLINGEPARCWAFMQATQGLRESCALATTLLPERHLTAV